MFGISYTSTNVIDILLSRDQFQRCTIEPKQKKLVRKDKEGNVIETIDSYDPKKVFDAFMKENPGNRIKVVLVNAYNTLKFLPSEPSVKYVIFESPQVLAKNKVKIIDAEPSNDGQGIWTGLKITPEDIHNEVKNTSPGFTFIPNIQKYSIRKIINVISKDLEKKNSFKKLVARYIFGMVKIAQWQDRTEKLKTMISSKKYNILINWLNTFSPDALCMSYMDVLFHASKISEEFCENPESEKSIKKFQNIAKRACATSDANFEDFMYLVNILPPNKKFKEKFIIKIPSYLKKYRIRYPLVPSKKGRKILDDSGNL